MIGRNRHHDADDDPKPVYDGNLAGGMPSEYREKLARVKKLPDGGKALKKYQQFWGIPYPTEIREFDIPGPKGKTIVLVGMGTTPVTHLADGPKGKAKSKRTRKGKRIPAVDASGRKMFLLTGKNSKAAKRELKKLGWSPETHYVPTGDMEQAGTFKRNTYWVHKHDDEGGTWPEVFEDQAGNIIYGPSTLRVGKWMRR